MLLGSHAASIRFLISTLSYHASGAKVFSPSSSIMTPRSINIGIKYEQTHAPRKTKLDVDHPIHFHATRKPTNPLPNKR